MDNLRRRRRDSRKINLDQYYEVKEWSKKLNVSRLKLRYAVRMAGVEVRKVKHWLRRNPGYYLKLSSNRRS